MSNTITIICVSDALIFRLHTTCANHLNVPSIRFSSPTPIHLYSLRRILNFFWIQVLTSCNFYYKNSTFGVFHSLKLFSQIKHFSAVSINKKLNVDTYLTSTNKIQMILRCFQENLLEIYILNVFLTLRTLQAHNCLILVKQKLVFASVSFIGMFFSARICKCQKW